MILRKLRKLRLAIKLRGRVWKQIRALLSEEAWFQANEPFLPQERVEEILLRTSNLQLVAPHSQSGNVSPVELLIIAALVSARCPRLAFEIGTFDGNTTLQIAANLPAAGRVITLDLPFENDGLPDDIAREDAQFIESAARFHRRFKGTAYADRVVEVFGDSKTFDFAGAADGAPIDFAFIDGSHSYEFVKNDTERILPLLDRHAVVLWHDYCRNWPGVVTYLNELGRSLPLRHVAGTTVVYFDSSDV